MEVFVELASTFGLPVALLGAVSYALYKLFNYMLEDSKAREEKYISIIQEQNNIIKEAQEVNVKCVDRLEDMEKKLDEVLEVITKEV